jgi:hypothetical protein
MTQENQQNPLLPTPDDIAAELGVCTAARNKLDRYAGNLEQMVQFLQQENTDLQEQLEQYESDTEPEDGNTESNEEDDGQTVEEALEKDEDPEV